MAKAPAQLTSSIELRRDSELHTSNDTPRVRATNAVNRSWSDVDPLTLVGTFGLTSFASSVLLHPFYLLVARQQCQHVEQSVSDITHSIWKKQGLRGLYRGVGVSTLGTVASECLYFVVIEKAKESLPFRSKEYRDFGAGLAADGLSGPLYVPFSIVSQRQMVGDEAFAATNDRKAGGAPRSYRGTAIVSEIVNREGWRALFRGTSVSLAMMPVSGCWWVVYEQLKGRAYDALGSTSGTASSSASPQHERHENSSIALALPSPSHATPSKPASPTGHHGLIAASPPSHPPIHAADVADVCVSAGVPLHRPSASRTSMLTSRTDNPLVNAAVGAVTGGIISGVLNPLYVVRTRLQVLDVPVAAGTGGLCHAAAKASVPTRWRAAAVARDVYTREGLRGFARGLRVNVVMGIGGSMLFGTFYEGAKRVADVSESQMVV